MRVGLLARAENRGLGNLTWEFFRHLHPAKTLVVLPSVPWEQAHVERYGGARIVGARELDDRVLRDFLEDLDVLYTAETPYAPQTFDLARRLGVRTVLHVMPEYAPWARNRRLARPDAFWVPTDWRVRQLRLPVRVVPVPIDRERVPFRLRTRAELFVHHAGTMAKGDRNGTRTLLRALGLVTQPICVALRMQRPPDFRIPRLPSHVQLEVEVKDVRDYWTMYESGSVLVLPRRYGGLSMPMNEALSSGMPIVASALSPQNVILPAETLVPARRTGLVRTQGAQVIPTHSSRPRAIARVIDRLAADAPLVETLSRAADATAEGLSWTRWRDRYLELLAEV